MNSGVWLVSAVVMGAVAFVSGATWL